MNTLKGRFVLQGYTPELCSMQYVFVLLGVRLKKPSPTNPCRILETFGVGQNRVLAAGRRSQHKRRFCRRLRVCMFNHHVEVSLGAI